MFVHFNSTAVLDFFCLGDFSQSCSHNNLVKNRPDYTLFKAGGIFLNFASESIRTLFDTYVPKNNPDWHVLRSGIKWGFWESDLSFRVGVFADRGMLPGLARTTALTTIVVQLRLN